MFALGLLCNGPLPGQAAERILLSTADLGRLTLDDLLNIDVTSVSRAPEKSWAAAAAVFVITQDDIRRTGVTSIADALRLAPGVDVAKLDSNKWAVGVRGFQDRLSRSVLVLIDGRSVYSPLFAGTYWEVQDTLMEDIERIEVIRGPGGTLWGANAFNGVINIITKHAKDTVGTSLSMGAGRQAWESSVRHGATTADGTNFRVYAKSFDRAPEFHPSSAEYDNFRMTRAGFRADKSISASDSWTVQGDIYDGAAGQKTLVSSFIAPFGQVVERNVGLSGLNLLGRWRRQTSDTADWALQLYYDRTERDEPTFSEDRDTFDIDFQRRARIFRSHEVTWGLGFRRTSNTIASVPTVAFNPSRRSDNVSSAFVQDAIELVPERLRLTLGSKLEHNDFTGFEVQPSARLAWTPSGAHTAWASISRAVRTPSQVDTDVAVSNFAALLGPQAVPGFTRLSGSPDFVSEKLVAYEAGYRVRPAQNLSFDLAGFYNRYSDLLSAEVNPLLIELSPGVPRLVIPFVFANKLHGETYGAELVADWAVQPWWRLRASHSILRMRIEQQADSTDVTLVARIKGSSPEYVSVLRSSMNLSDDFDLDVTFRHVSALPARGVGSYHNLDVRVGWRVNKRVALSLLGQNLLQSHHPEFAEDNADIIELRRAVFLRASVSF